MRTAVADRRWLRPVSLTRRAVGNGGAGWTFDTYVEAGTGLLVYRGVRVAGQAAGSVGTTLVYALPVGRKASLTVWVRGTSSSFGVNGYSEPNPYSTGFTTSEVAITGTTVTPAWTSIRWSARLTSNPSPQLAIGGLISAPANVAATVELAFPYPLEITG